eukprot:scaffold9012_cov123-Chaetoceros_neogracile.AAC.1
MDAPPLLFQQMSSISKYKASTAAVLPGGDDLAAELPTTYGVPTISATTNDPSAELPTTSGVPTISATAAELTTSAELLTNDPLTIEPSNWKQ